MFTGIIQAVGHISHLTEGAGGAGHSTDVRVTVAAGGLDLTDAQRAIPSPATVSA